MLKHQSKLLKTIALALVSITLLTACGRKKDVQARRVVIWTSNSEFAQYVELFNKTHKENSAVLVYKDNPALSMPPARDEAAPDIVVGSWLRTDNPQKYYKSLDYIFDNRKLTTDIFYSQLLTAGQKKGVQYLLPVSFNLPALVFSNDNKDLVPDNYTLTLKQLREAGSAYNEKNKKGAYTKMGFTPLSNNEFIYLTTKIYGANFREEKGEIVWAASNLINAANELRDWVIKENTSAQVEEDFAYKYLFMPYYRQVTTGRTLFAYTTSDQLFKAMKDQDLGIDYRWIVQDRNLPIEDSFTMMGIYKNSRNLVGATEFISWFFQSESQRAILERKDRFNLETEIFGIAGGFSALRDVTEHILPVFYTQLLTNLPPAQMLSVPNQLPARWESYRTMVVEPYVKDLATSDNTENVTTILALESEWRRKVFD
ncbi:MAG: extracellular solute-binding protein [Treponema sp.]|nr:extracellular solute-binding protein [Treponema sp.]